MGKNKTSDILLRLCVLGILLMSSQFIYAAKDSITVYGYAFNPAEDELADWPIFVNGKPVVKTDSKGYYEVRLMAGVQYEFKIDYFGQVLTKKIQSNKVNQRLRVDFHLAAQVLDAIDVNIVKHDPPSIIEIDPKKLVEFPVIQAEDLLTKIGLGIRKRSELSSSYNVRGGNFDENLIYINDIEVYRPFLARSGQQEGLSFVNTYMTDNLSFSSGGFEAKYGDKLSSVLDVQYHKPKAFSGSVEASLLGGSIHVQDRVDVGKRRDRLTYVFGARYRTLQYLLGTLDVSGDYRPKFADFQSLISYRLKDNLSLSWFSTYAQNQYVVEPQSRETNFGTIRDAVRLFVGFGGAERIEYRTFLNALSLEYKPNKYTTFKLISSNFDSEELEHFTVEGAYRLEELENNLGSENFAEARALLGSGYFINHARNDLDLNVTSHKALAKIRKGMHVIETGVKFQQEIITDRIKEWNYNDSSEYRVNAPDHGPYEIVLEDVVNVTNTLNSYRVMGYFQDNMLLSKANNVRLNIGVRSNYWSLNKQNLISPRMQFSMEPNKKYNQNIQDRKNEELQSLTQDQADSLYNKISAKYDEQKKTDIMIKASVGAYNQPPFYRELRNIKGELNKELKAQESYHFVVGSDWLFKAWKRQFRFINELYYKRMFNLVPYTINNVKLRYDALNSSEGYAYGFDARVNGEFISGLESWVNLSLLSTKENITYTDENNEVMETGYIKRPTDQRVNFSILFQDELPIDTTFKLQLNLVIGSKMPYYFNGPFRYNENYTLPAYRRVDIGFSKQVKRFTKSDTSGPLNSLWMSLEIFNVLQVNNVASYLWVEDLRNNIYGVPNYLTGRRLNLKIIARF